MAATRAIIFAVLSSGLALAEDSLATATKLNNQAFDLAHEGRLKDAENLYRSALAIEPYDDLARARIANNLAWLYERQDRYPEAEQLFHRALLWRQKNLPPNSVEIAYSFNNLADIYRIEGRDWEARNLLEDALRILREFHPDDAAFPVMTSNLAVVLCKVQQYDRAEDLLRDALKRSELQHGADSRDVGVAANNLAQVLQAKKDFQDAAVMYKRAIGIFEALGPEATSELAAVLGNTGWLLEQQHQIDKARETEQRALDLVSSDGSRQLRATILQNLGNIVASSGNAAGSLPYFEESLNIQEKTLGCEHPATARLLLDYAAATLRAGQKAMARKLRKRAEELLARLQSVAPGQFTVSVNSLREAQ
jgi:tetratricopeptide (TPR) repeat protein